MRNTTIDAIDGTILADRTFRRSAKRGPRVGDFIYMRDGTLRRFAFQYSDGSLQTESKLHYGSFYLGPDGSVSYSGGLDSVVPRHRIEDTGEHQPAAFWFFSHNEHRAHNGVTVSAPCRVFKELS